jgi:hypothetical protein
MRKTFITLTCVLLTFLLQAQSIYNNDARIVSESGTYWVVGTGNFDLTSQSTTNLTTIANLKIESGAKLTITSGSILTISGTMTNSNGTDYTKGLVIKSGGQLKYSGSSTNAYAKVELSLAGPNFHFIVPSVREMYIGSSVIEAMSSFENANFKGDLLWYDESLPSAITNKDLGWSYFDGYGLGGGTFQNKGFQKINPNQGYNIYPNGTIQLKGALNCGEHTFTLYKYGFGWNLIGNPYPCNYDLSGIYALNNAGQGVDNTVYVNKGGTYSTKNLITNDMTNWPSWSNKIIPPMQGFFVHTTTYRTFITLPVGSKSVTSVLAIAKSTSIIEASSIRKIKLSLTNSTESDETIVGLLDEATTGFDGAYDAYKLFGNSTTIPAIYSELGSVKYAINYMSEPISEPLKIPVTIELKSQGSYRIDVTQFENLDGLDVYLRDGAKMTRLNQNTSYQLPSSLAAGTYTDFELIIGGNATGIEKNNSSTEKFKTWYSNYTLYIECPDDITEDNGTLTIYDIQGKPVYQNTRFILTPGQTIQVTLNLPKGFYISRLAADNQFYISNIVII